MRVRVEESILEDLLQIGAEQTLRDESTIDARLFERGIIGDLDRETSSSVSTRWVV